ncbi:DUF362 domain-containing protein [Candidatus Dojkabacteria bacterium]|nr:DUF362 domain-containing protein [Candidatus Dojkabacteria bacterium]
MAGVTLGIKNWVGILREDSRAEFHADGPFKSAIGQMFTEGSTIRYSFKSQDLFWEKMTEVALSVQEKLRLTLFVGTEAQTTVGPDRQLYFAKTHIARPEIGIILASNNPVAADVVALAFLIDLYKNHTPFTAKIMANFLHLLNGRTKPLSKITVWAQPFIINAIKIGLGTEIIEPEFLDECDENLKETILKALD